MTIRLRRPENLSVDLTSCAFDTFILVSLNGASNGIKWPGKINFQTAFILEQQVILFHFKFLEVQTNEISHRECMDECNIFCVWTSTHVSFQLPILLLSTHIRPKFYFSFFVLFPFLRTSLMDACKAKNISIYRYQIKRKYGRWKVEMGGGGKND